MLQEASVFMCDVEEKIVNQIKINTKDATEIEISNAAQYNQNSAKDSNKEECEEAQ